MIPKYHGSRLHEVADEHLADLLPTVKTIVLKGLASSDAQVLPQYNLLQNNGRLAHQVRTDRSL